jgi:hypothetical protein
MVKQEKGKVYVHCVQGVSRSATVTLAYLIYTEKMPYQDAFKLVKDRRGIVSPNLGFMVQLMMFYQRLFESYSQMPIQPRVFAVSSHQVEDPFTIVARFIFEEKLYTGRNHIKLDPRGVFIIATDKETVIWVGAECHHSYKQKYLELARAYVVKLAKYEGLVQDAQEVEQGK